MLRSRKKLGGELKPVKSKTPAIADEAITRKVIDETQLPVSTVEATLIDAVTYSNEIGGADEVLRWMRTGLSGTLVNPDEFGRLTRSVTNQLPSVNARTGFLLEYMLKAGLAAKPEINRLVHNAREQLDRHPTYRWGEKSADSKFFNEWRLHVSKTYLDQLNSAAVFE